MPERTQSNPRMSKKRKAPSTLKGKELSKKGKPLTLDENFELSVQLIQRLLIEYVGKKLLYTGQEPAVSIQLTNIQFVRAALRRYTAMRRLVGLVLHIDDIAAHMGVLEQNNHAVIEGLLCPTTWAEGIGHAIALAEMIEREMLKKGLPAPLGSTHLNILRVVAKYAENPSPQTHREAAQALDAVYDSFLNYGPNSEHMPSPDEVLKRDCMVLVAVAHMSVDAQFQADVAKKAKK